ncbi:MAG: Fe-S protein assembly co-chaperone HscB [Candidatus Manganitrophaceae bacterium]|nr:MAG: Fe-S protein assembly co-chaperone HscB [Candidatus Manganitrophaceae bacterium]
MKLSGMSEVSTKRACWHCGAQIDSIHLCNQCGTLQRIPEGIDYFTLFGLGPRLSLDSARLEATFYELSRKFHPDFYQKKSSEEQAISLENSAVLNKAYRVLRDPVQRVEYLVRWVEGGSTVDAEAPADLFDEILELQELLESIKETPDHPDQRGRRLDALKGEQARFGQIQEEGERALEGLSKEWDRLSETSEGSGLTEAQRRSLSEMKRILARRAYLERVLNDIQSGMDKLEKGS